MSTEFISQIKCGIIQQNVKSQKNAQVNQGRPAHDGPAFPCSTPCSAPPNSSETSHSTPGSLQDHSCQLLKITVLHFKKSGLVSVKMIHGRSVQRMPGDD